MAGLSHEHESDERVGANRISTDSQRIEIRPNLDEAVEQFKLLRRLARRYDFPLNAQLDSLAERGLPVWPCEVDWSTAPTAGYAVATYQLAERLQGALAALIHVARHSDGDLA